MPTDVEAAAERLTGRELISARMRRLSARSWAVECRPEGSANAGVVIGDDRTMVVDTRVTPAMGEELARVVSEACGCPIEDLIVVNTHFHGDHVFGNGAFRGATIVSSLLTQEAERGEWERQIEIFTALRPHQAEEIATARKVTPTIGFERSAVIDLGGVDVRLEPVGPAHTPGDVVAIVESEDVAFVADLVFNGHWPATWNADMAGWLRSLERLAPLLPATVVPGHGPPGGPEILELMAACLRFIVELELAGEDEAAAIARSPFADHLNARRVEEARRRVREQMSDELRDAAVTR